jgi:hypothetical protein
MGEPVSDAAFQLLGACVHSLRFGFGAPLDYPYAPARLAKKNPPPALFRRLQAASPPPDRDGGRWETGMSRAGRPFDPNRSPDQLAEVEVAEGAASLDLPDPGTIVLDRWFSVPRRQQTMAFPGDDRGKYLTSIRYWAPPIPPLQDRAEELVEYYDEYRMEWDRSPEKRAWVAVSFDAFWPPERDSADLIIPLGRCDEFCPPSGL